MLWVQDVNGDQTPIVAYNIAITETLSSFDQLSFVFLVDPNNRQDPNYVAVSMMVPRTMVTEPTTGKKFMILQSNPVSVGDKVQYTVTCTSVGYKLHDNYVTTTVTNTQTLKACMDMITGGTPFSYQIDGTFANYSFSETFGGGYSDDLLTQLASDFGFEFYFDNYLIHIEPAIGNSGAFLFVEGANAGKISIQEDYSTITTYIKGNGKQNDDGTYACSAEYTSPAFTTWGKIWAEPYQSDSITDATTLAAKLKSQIHDYPDVQYSMDYADFKNNLQGFNNDTSVGNYGYLRNRFGIDISIRVQSRTYYPQDTKNAGSITFGNKIFDPNIYINKMREAYQSNVSLGKSLAQSISNISSKISSTSETISKIGGTTESLSNKVATLQQQIQDLQDSNGSWASGNLFVDLSSNNGATSTTDQASSWYANLYNNGVKGAMIKLTQGSASGTNYTNPIFDSQKSNVTIAGMKYIGAYHYFTAISVDDASAEAELFLAKLQAKSIDKSLIVACDVEDSSLSTSESELNTELTAFFKVLTDAGYTSTCLYGSASWFDTRFSSSLAKYTWKAAWGSSKPSSCSAWQYTDEFNGLSLDASKSYDKAFI